MDPRGVNRRPGTLGRRSIHGPGFQNLNLAARKVISLRERHRLQFRVDFFNFFNHTNFSRVQENQRSGIFGRIVGAADGRKVQLMFRYTF